MKEAQEQIESADRYTRDRVRVFRGTGDRSFYSGEPFVFTPDMSSSFGHSMLGDSERHDLGLLKIDQGKFILKRLYI